MTPLTPARLAELDALYAKATAECYCRFACECGRLDASRELERILPDEYPALSAAARMGLESAARVAELEAELATARKEHEETKGYLIFECKWCKKLVSGRQAKERVLCPCGGEYALGLPRSIQPRIDTLAARLREAVELLRPLAATADWDDADPYARAAAAFLASEAAK